MVRQPMPFPEFYTRIIEGDHGLRTINQPGNRPRGTFTRAQPSEVKLMVVLRNPGQPNPVELSIESGAKGRQLAEIIWNYCGEVWEGKYYSKTLSIARQEVCSLLGIKEAECTRRAMFTNLVRCTTHRNSPPSAEAVRIGSDWLREEIELWQPNLVIAYGNDVAMGMQRHGIRYDAQLPHPAALGEWLRPGRREGRITEVRKELAL
jgi:hypothetical protein